MRDPYLRAYLRVGPLARALIRSREVALLAGAGLAAPLVDLGHGDGVFAAELARAGVETAVGVDRDIGELRRARAAATAHGARIRLVAADLARLPFRTGAFASALSNCVLEHVEGVEAALRETARVVRPGGRIAATVVGDRYLALLARPRLLRALGLDGLARRYEDLVTRLFVHRRYWSAEEWRAAFERAGLRVVSTRPYVSPRRQAAMDLALPFALWAHLVRRLLGRFVLLPGRWNAVPLERLVGPEPGDQGEGANVLLIASR